MNRRTKRKLTFPGKTLVRNGNFIAGLTVFILILGFEPTFAQQYKLRYEYEPGKQYKYKRISEEQAYGELHANLSGSMDKRTEGFFSYTGKKKSKNGLTIDFYQDTVFVQETPPPADNQKVGVADNILSQTAITFDISLRGEVQNVAIAESFTKKKNLLQYENAEKRLAQMGLILPVLPEDPVSPGKTWTITQKDTITPNPALGKENSLRIISTAVTYHADEVVKYLDRNCLKIRWEAFIVNEEKNLEKNQERFQEEKTSTTGVFYFAIDEKILAGMEQQAQVESTIVLYGKDNGVIPYNQTSKISITLQP